MRWIFLAHMRTMFAFTALSGLALGKDIFVANYGGSITRLSLTETYSNYSLMEAACTFDCGSNPGWLEIDPSTNALLCMNEAYVRTWQLSKYGGGLSDPRIDSPEFRIHRLFH